MYKYFFANYTLVNILHNVCAGHIREEFYADVHGVESEWLKNYTIYRKYLHNSINNSFL